MAAAPGPDPRRAPLCRRGLHLIQPWPSLLRGLQAAGPVHSLRQVHQQDQNSAGSLQNRPQFGQDCGHGRHC